MQKFPHSLADTIKYPETHPDHVRLAEHDRINNVQRHRAFGRIVYGSSLHIRATLTQTHTLYA